MRAAASCAAGTGVRPAKASSSTSGGKLPLQTIIASASAMSTMLTTNSPVRRMLAVVSFSTPSRPCRPMMTIGGSWEKTLKKLIGAALSCPAGDRVVTSAIGRGPTKFVSRR